MISKTIGCRGLAYFQTNPYGTVTMWMWVKMEDRCETTDVSLSSFLFFHHPITLGYLMTWPIPMWNCYSSTKIFLLNQKVPSEKLSLQLSRWWCHLYKYLNYRIFAKFEGVFQSFQKFSKGKIAGRMGEQWCCWLCLVCGPSNWHCRHNKSQRQRQDLTASAVIQWSEPQEWRIILTEKVWKSLGVFDDLWWWFCRFFSIFYNVRPPFDSYVGANNSNFTMVYGTQITN